MIGFFYQRERVVVQMMVTIGVYMRRWQRMVRRWAADPKVHMLLQGGGYLLAGFLSGAASLVHYLQPLTLGLVCAQSGWPAVLVATGGAVGYAVFWGNIGFQGVVWTILGLAAALLLRGRRAQMSTLLLMPALAALIVAGTGLAFQHFRLEAPPIPIYLLRVFMAAGATVVFCFAMERRDPMVDWLVCGLAVLCLAQVIPAPYLGLGYLAAGALAMLGAFPAAALAGLALDLAQVTPTPMTAVLCLSYFIRMIPNLRPIVQHLGPGFSYILVMGLCGSWDVTPLPGLLLGSFAAMLLPKKVSIAQRRGETGTAQVRLELASAVLRQTENLLWDIESAPIDEQALMVRAAERACGSCPCRKTCREQPGQLSPAILHRPLGNGADLPSGCRKSGRLLMEMRRSQEQLRSIRADRDRQAEYRTAVGQQYHFLSEYLQDLSDSLARRKEPSRPWYQPEVAAYSASMSRANGDRCLWFTGVECKYYVLLCDGMGTGPEAASVAQQVGSMLRRMLSAGYPAPYALRSINSLCALQGQAGAVTLDLVELQLDTGKATLYKWGAAPSYVISRGEIIKIGTATPPPGLSITEARETVERLSLRRGETLILLSDGAGGEESLHRAWLDSQATTGELAARILQSRQSATADDATVAVVRLHSLPVST